jgi:CRP-like cAMP-binding protein
MCVVSQVGSHVVACCWHFLHTLAASDGSGTPTWWTTYCQTALPLDDGDMCSASLHTRYILSLYWAVTTLTTIGYGDILPVTNSEYIYTILCMYVGVSFYAFIAANVATVLASLDTKCQIQDQKMDKLNEFLKATKMPPPLRRRLRKYFSLYWTQLGALMPYDTRKLIDDINLPDLKGEVTECLYEDQLTRVPFLKNRDITFVTNVVTKLVPLHVLTGELVAREGEVAAHLFFLWNGKIECSYRTQILHYKVPGSYFGDMAVLLLKRHINSFRAHCVCDVYMLSKAELLDAIQYFPQYGLEMRELAIKRLRAINEELDLRNARRSSRLSVCSAGVDVRAATEQPVTTADPAVQPARSDSEANKSQRSHECDIAASSSVLADIYEDRLSQRVQQLLLHEPVVQDRASSDPWDQVVESLIPVALPLRRQARSAGERLSSNGGQLDNHTVPPPELDRIDTAKVSHDQHDRFEDAIKTSSCTGQACVDQQLMCASTKAGDCPSLKPGQAPHSHTTFHPDHGTEPSIASPHTSSNTSNFRRADTAAFGVLHNCHAAGATAPGIRLRTLSRGTNDEIAEEEEEEQEEEEEEEEEGGGSGEEAGLEPEREPAL